LTNNDKFIRLEKNLRTLLRIASASTACATSLLLCYSGIAAADPPTDTQAPTGSFFSSLKQALKQDLNYEVVRGHFDVGSPPDTHRFYCLVDIRTGRNEGYGVGGEPFLRPDGMTGIKAGGVSPASCDKAEEQGMLVTTGYVVNLGSKAANKPVSLPKQTGELNKNTATSDRIDVAGLRLGMSPDQVRAILKSKALSNHYESMEALGGAHSSDGGRFVNVIAAWTATPQQGESFEVMFTPVPGKERVMAIVHSVAYSADTAVAAMAVQTGLVTKYGGYAVGEDLPESPTWRLQAGGNVLTGDSCNGRGIFGGLGKADFSTPARQNLALKTTPDEFRNEIEQCGVAIVTEDQSMANGNVSRRDGLITRFTVSAYSPAIALDGASAALQLLQTAGNSSGTPPQARTQESSPPNL
jgi:hypothetical protein